METRASPHIRFVGQPSDQQTEKTPDKAYEGFTKAEGLWM